MRSRQIKSRSVQKYRTNREFSPGPDCKLRIYCYQAHQSYRIVEQMVKENHGWHLVKLNPEKCDLMYVWHNDSDKIVYNYLLNYENRILSRYPYIRHLSRKDQLQRMMKIAYEQCSNSFDFVP